MHTTRRGLRLTTAAVVAATLLAACTTEQQSDPSPTLTSTTSTAPPDTSVPDDTTATTTPPETTAAPETTEETTTTIAAPSGPTASTVPLLIGGADGGWLSLGSWSIDHWESDFGDDGVPIPPNVAPGTAMTVSNLSGESAGTTGSNVDACFDERIGPTIDAAVSPPDPPGFGYNAVALPTPTWPLKPRPIAVTTAAPASYQTLGEAIYADLPVDGTLGAVEQLVVADLDGDGDDEALVSFEYIQPDGGPGTAGDFSAIMLVDTETTTSSTVIESHIASDVPPDTFLVIGRTRVIDVADVNGDGRMEVAVHSWYYEGASVLLYEYDGTTLVEALGTGCGS
ncbi:MAG: hypothetical protein WBP59_06395 [Ilumatobacteraceae bacterium]